MPRNSSGTYSLPAGNPVVSNTLIQTTWANPTMSDLGSGITDSLDRSGRGAMLAPLKNIDGTAVAPSITFSSEGTLGAYRVSAGVLGIAAAGALILSIASTGLTFTTPVVLPVGSNTAPSLTFTGNTNTGIYSPATNQVAITTAGVQRLLVDAAGGLTSSGAIFAFSGAGGNAIQASSAGGALTFQTGGANTRLSIDSAGVTTFAGGATFGGALILPNATAIDWKDTSGTARRMALFSSASFFLGDLDNAVPSSLLFLRANSFIETDINGTSITTVTASGLGIGVVPTARLQVQASAPVTSPAWLAVDTAVFSQTTSNVMQLHVGATGGTMAYAFAVAAARSVGAVGYIPGTDAMTFTTASGERARFDNGGNLGLGMVPSAWRAGARALQFGTFGALNIQQNGSLALTFAAYESGSNVFSYTTSGDLPARYRQVSGVHFWDTAPSGTTGGTVTFVNVMSLDAAGNLNVSGSVSAPTFTGNLTGNVTGNVSGSSGSTTGNAATATALQTARNIGGVSFNGTANILPTTLAAGATDGTFELGWKDLPQNAQTAGYTLVLADRGKSITITTGGVTVPASIFSAGNVVTITNNSGTAQTVTQGASMTMHQAGTTNTGNRTLLAWGIATVEFLPSNVSIIAGNIT